MRRRLLLNNGSENTLTLSSTSGTINARENSYTSYIYVYYNEELVTDLDVQISCDKDWVEINWYSTNGYFRLNSNSYNPSFTNTRSAVISVTYEGLTVNYRLTQRRSTWNVTPTAVTSNFAASTQETFNVLINDYSLAEDYTISESLDWITTSKNDGIVTVTFSENTTQAERSGTITVTLSGESKTVTVRQGIIDPLPVIDVYDNIINIITDSYYNNDIKGVLIPNTNAYAAKYLLDCNGTPNKESTSTYPASARPTYFGGDGYTIQGITNNDGQANTATILAVDNSNSTSWQTASTISNSNNNQYVHPGAQYCWRYNPSNTNSQGQWYLPSIGELTEFGNVYDRYLDTISLVGGRFTIVNPSLMSSTESDAEHYMELLRVDSNTRYTSYNQKKIYESHTLPFHKL